jgi:hypothetical protein
MREAAFNQQSVRGSIGVSKVPREGRECIMLVWIDVVVEVCEVRVCIATVLGQAVNNS